MVILYLTIVQFHIAPTSSDKKQEILISFPDAQAIIIIYQWYCTPNQKQASFVLYLKIINTY